MLFSFGHVFVCFVCPIIVSCIINNNNNMEKKIHFVAQLFEALSRIMFWMLVHVIDHPFDTFQTFKYKVIREHS